MPFMKLSTKLLLTTLASIGSLILVTTVILHQLDSIHTTTITVIGRYAQARDQRDEIKSMLLELKSLTLEMIVERRHPKSLARLTREFSSNRQQLEAALTDYGEHTAIDATDRELFEAVSTNAALAIEYLDQAAQDTHAGNAEAAIDKWYSCDHIVDQFLDAQSYQQAYTTDLMRRGKEGVEKAHRTALLVAETMSVIIVIVISGLAFWAYRGVSASVRTLQEKLDEISSSLDLGQRIDLGSANEMQRATEAINRLLERAEGSYEEIAARRDEASRRARLDPLTGLLNRAGALSAIDHALDHAHKTGQKLGLLFIDLDGFKTINDTYGHDAGDSVLQETANRLRSALRGEDIAARFGGDEFVALLVGLSQVEAAGTIARKIVGMLAKTSYHQDTALAVGASIGIAIYPDHGESPEALLQAADAAMYEVKRAGKNGFAFAGSPG